MLRKLIAAQFKRPHGLLAAYISRRMYRNNAEIYEFIGEHAELAEGMTVFEIGYGHGLGIELFLKRHDLAYIGLDYSRSMHRRARRKFRRQLGTGRLTLHCEDFNNFPHTEASVDRILFANVSYFWKDLEPPFAKMAAMLREGGLMIGYLTDKPALDRDRDAVPAHFYHHDLATVKLAVERGGLELLEVRRLDASCEDYLVIKARKVSTRGGSGPSRDARAGRGEEGIL